MIQVTCSNCGIRILVPDTVQGRDGICFGCGAKMVVPKASKEAPKTELAFKKGDRVSDRYVILEHIGKGGMGVVYRAHDTLVDEEVALKFMKPNLLRTQKGQKTFIQEAQIARRLRHENIVAVHDVTWTADGIPYLSMEFLKGRSLRQFLRKHRQDRRLLDVRFGVSVVAQILSALDYAHRTVVHRDLKPENIMLLPGENIKVLDFGVARAIDEDAAQPGDDDGDAAASGTFAYASPEQRRRWSVDLRSDLYTVGLIMYELFTLRTPIDEQWRIGRVRNDVSPSLVEIWKRAVHQDREGRWQSAAAFRDSLLEAFESSYAPVTEIEIEGASGGKVSTEDMVYLEGGSFLMGNNGVREEAPEFEIQVDPFYMDKYPVTVAQYTAFLEATGHGIPKFWHDQRYNGSDQPAIGVTYYDALAYAKWAGKELPSEAQWEFAARGKENRKYPWGALEPDTTRCNYTEYLGMPSIVTMHEAGRTPDGLYDLGGNVYEWTCDPYTPYTKRLEGNPHSSIPLRAVRGGCWGSPAKAIRCTHRRGMFAETQEPTVGFRCVLSAHGNSHKG